MNKLKVLELFSGIRATSEALNRQGIDHTTYTVEYDKKVQEVANLLWETNEPTRDITQWEPTEEYDLVVAGFPCQPFSMAGKGQGFHDEKGRGKLYQDTLRVIKKANPDYVILENVKAITFQKHKWIITEIENTLKEWGYKVHTQIINAKNYLPQNRERVFIMASKIKQPNEIKETTHNFILKDFLEESVSEDLYYGAEKLEKIYNWAAQERPLKKVAHTHTHTIKTITTRTQPGTASQQLVSCVPDLEQYLLEHRVNIKGLFYDTFNAENYITGIGTERERERERESQHRHSHRLRSKLKTKNIWKFRAIKDKIFNTKRKFKTYGLKRLSNR